MFELSPFVLGTILVILGLCATLLTFFFLRAAPQLEPLVQLPTSPPPSLQLPSHGEAIILIRQGGRVAYLNDAARELFNLWEENANLERLALRARPADTFLRLCASEGQGQVTINGRFVEGKSYFAPYGENNSILVSLHRPQLMPRTEKIGDTAEAGEGGEVTSTQAFNIFTELSKTMTASLELEATLQAILEGVEHFIPSDFSEITILENSSTNLSSSDGSQLPPVSPRESREKTSPLGQRVLTPYRFVGTPGVDRRLEKDVESYTTYQGYSGYLVIQRKPLFIANVSAFEEVRPAADRKRFPFRAYVGVPLMVAGEPIGTLEMASLTQDGFSESDLEVLLIIAGQAAVALHNSLMYQEEQQRALELAGLANLAQAVSSLRDSQDLFSRLMEGIAPLLNVKVLGFLVYNENRQVLEGRTPFTGIPDNVVEWYQGLIPNGSPAESQWLSAEPIISKSPEDSRLELFGLHHLALAAGVHYSVLMPLASGGRILGYLFAADKCDGTPFQEADHRLMAIIAGQAAPIIENAALVQQSRRRAQRAETLRRIASLTGSTANLHEILRYSIIDLARLLQADIATIFLLDETHGELRVHKPSVFGIPPEVVARLARIPIDDPQYPATVTGSRNQFMSGALGEEPVISLYQPMVDLLGLNSAIDVPLIIRERGIGELMLGSFRSNFFENGDLISAATAAGQLAAAIEQASLYNQTDQGLRQRVDQLTALTRVSREISSTLDLQYLIQRVYDELLRTTRATCGTIILFDIDADSLVPATEPPILLYRGDPPSSQLHPLEKYVMTEGESVIVDDFEAPGMVVEGVGRASALHEGIRSALVTPIAYLGKIAGLISLHARTPGMFDSAAKEISETLSIQAAIALGNAYRYQDQVRRSEQLNRRVETLSKLIETSEALQSDLGLEHVLEAIAYAIQAATPFDAVLISVFNPQNDALQRTASAGIPIALMAELRQRLQPWSGIHKLLDPQFRLGGAYFIPVERTPVIPPEVNVLITLTGEENGPDFNDRWKPEDLLALPLLDPEGHPLGLISVDAPRNHLRPDLTTIEALEIFGSQASLAIENTFRMQGLRSQLNEVQGELDRARKAAQSAQEHLPVLLHKDLEQTLAIQHLGQRASRIHAGLSIAEIVNRQLTRTDVLQAFARELLTRMDFEVALAAEPQAGTGDLSTRAAHLLFTLGTIASDINPESLLGQRNPLRHTLQTGETLLVPDLENQTEWQNMALLRALGAKAFVCLPIAFADPGAAVSGRAGEHRLLPAALLVISRVPVAQFTVQDEQLFSLLTRQVTIAIQNLGLLEETQRRLREVNLLLDFSRQIGSLDTESILNALVDSALHVVPAANTALVVLWDAQRQELTPHASAGYANSARLMEMTYRPGEALPGQVFESGTTQLLEEISFARHYNLTPENLQRYRDAIAGQFPLASLTIPILIGGAGGEHGARPVGVLELDSRSTAAFTSEDQALISSLVQQTALTLENARLYRASEQRSQQLEALTDVAATITSSLEMDDLIATLLDQLQAILPYDTGTLWMRQRIPGQKENVSAKGGGVMMVRAARGFSDSEQRIGISVAIEDSLLLNEMFQSSSPISVPNIQDDPRFPSLMEFERLSWLGVPLAASGEMIGVIALEKTEPNFYTPDQIQIVTTFASQAAVSLENAGLYQESVRRAQELDQRSQFLAMLNRLSTELSGSLDTTHILSFAVEQLYQVIHCSAVSAILFEDRSHGAALPEASQTRAFMVAEYPFSGGLLGYPLPDAPIFERLRQTFGVFNCEDVWSEPELLPLGSFFNHYDTSSLLMISIATGSATGSPDISADGAREPSEHYLHGLLLAHTKEPYRFEADEVELARTISNQVAIAVQNARLFAETRNFSVELENRVEERTAELAKEHKRAETLLRIITELSASLDLDQVLHRTLNVLNEAVDAAQITVMISRPGEKTLHRLASVSAGQPDEGPNPGEVFRKTGQLYPDTFLMAGGPTVFEVDQGLAGWIIQNRQSALVDDVLRDDRWVQSPNLTVERHRSVMGVPLMSGADALGALLLMHPEVGHFSLDQLDLVQAAANQVAIAVNNAELFRLIRDQAEDLGSMLRNQQIETSRSKAILEAVADGVLVTDAARKITLFNASAEKILGLDRSQVIGKSLEQFTGLFGGASRDWMETIKAWSQEPSASHSRETYSTRIHLEDGRVIAVRLAPVILRNDFLGTVSIFSDITHQVEVDRLKSEFVATVSHELRTPMTSIKGYVEILLMGAAGPLSEQQNRFLQVVKTNSERLAVLVNDLLDISRIEAGRVTLTLQPLNLDEMASELIKDMERRSKDDNKPMTIQKVVAPGLPRVLGDVERVRQILENLLDNAYLYNMPDGKILVQMQVVDGMVQVDVKDSGMGIPINEQSRVFERFYRGENPLLLGVSGTGLGLAIVEHLVQMHNGRIWLESKGIQGEGTTFSFTLPAYE